MSDVWRQTPSPSASMLYSRDLAKAIQAAQSLQQRTLVIRHPSVWRSSASCGYGRVIDRCCIPLWRGPYPFNPAPPSPPRRTADLRPSTNLIHNYDTHRRRGRPRTPVDRNLKIHGQSASSPNVSDVVRSRQQLSLPLRHCRSASAPVSLDTSATATRPEEIRTLQRYSNGQMRTQIAHTQRSTYLTEADVVRLPYTHVQQIILQIQNF